jgi:acyl-CoA thioesterase-1
MFSNKKLITAALIFALLAALVVSCSKRNLNIKNVASTGTTIVCFGDSITRGHGVEQDQSYPAILGKMLHMSVINAGIDGDTSTEGLKRVESDVVERGPFLVVIEFGGNDFMQKILLDETLANVRRMIDMAQARGAMVALFDISAPFLMSEYRKPFADLAREKSAIFISGALSGILLDPSMKSDFVHPNALGYRAIAHRVFRAILPYVNQNALYKRFGK